MHRCIPALALLLTVPLPARAADSCDVPCGPQVQLEARAGYVFLGNKGPTAAAALAVGRLGLGIPDNVLFVAELGYTRGAERRIEILQDDVQVDTHDLSAGVRAYWPPHRRLVVRGELLLGAARHAFDPRFTAADASVWTFMGQLGLGGELRLVSSLYLVTRFKLTLYNDAAVALTGFVVDGDAAIAHAVHRAEIETVRLDATAGLSWRF